MRIRPLCSAPLLLGAATLCAVDSLAHARQAQAMPRSDAGSQVIRIANAARRVHREDRAIQRPLAVAGRNRVERRGARSFSLQRDRFRKDRAPAVCDQPSQNRTTFQPMDACKILIPATCSAARPRWLPPPSGRARHDWSAV